MSKPKITNASNEDFNEDFNGRQPENINSGISQATTTQQYKK